VIYKIESFCNSFINWSILLANFLGFIVLGIRIFNTLLVLIISFTNTSIVKGKGKAYLLLIASIISYIIILKCF
jgi:hypothetical protein